MFTLAVYSPDWTEVFYSHHDTWFDAEDARQWWEHSGYHVELQQ